MTKGERIKLLREKANMTQEELAKLLNTTKQTIYKYEQSVVTNIPSDRVERIAEVLNTTPAYIMGWESDKPETSKKIDAATDVLIRMETDKLYSELVLTLYKMDNDRLLAVKAMLDSLKLFSSAERK